METFLTDTEIVNLINVSKQMTIQPDVLFQNMKDKRGHKSPEYEMLQNDGSSFVIKIRISNENSLDFSVILGYVPAKSTKPFLLRRYNGKSHEHRNRLEREDAFYDFHIHSATERYQREGNNEEFYAEMSGRYSTPREALNCLITDCNIAVPPVSQLTLEL